MLRALAANRYKSGARGSLASFDHLRMTGDSAALKDDHTGGKIVSYHQHAKEFRPNPMYTKRAYKNSHPIQSKVFTMSNLSNK